MKLDAVSTPVSLAAARAARAIPPAWPLAASVAVNPYLGQAHLSLAEASARLARVGAGPVVMPRPWYLDQWRQGLLTEVDLAEALAAASSPLRPRSLAALLAALQQTAPSRRPPPTVADLAAQVSGIDWPGIIADRFNAWAAAYCDQGQALWIAPRDASAYGAWRAFATHDLTPEILGLSGFASDVYAAPDRAHQALQTMVDQLAPPEAALETYFHQLLVTLGGWAQYARYLQWQADLRGEMEATPTDFLTIRLQWEASLYRVYGDLIAADWQASLALHASPAEVTADDVLDEILQEASERSAQRGLSATLAEPVSATPSDRPALQAAFCIDVRSEVFRRALDAQSDTVQTLGFAGFFGLGVAHRRFASDVEELRLPALLAPQLASEPQDQGRVGLEFATRIQARAKRAWMRFKLAAVSSFAFVEAAGPLYVEKLLRDALGFAGHTDAEDPPPRFRTEPPLPSRIAMAASVLRAMSWTGGFARLVLIIGHGAKVVNAPHASALQCGACGGYSGEANARLLVSLLNDPQVRQGLVGEGFSIPSDTLFLAGLHDTPSDEVRLFTQDFDTAAHSLDIAQAKAWLAAAGALARTERAVRLPRAKGEASLKRRGGDWSETRPEWGLAGCQAFIIAPRRRTLGKSLQGRAFLHDYDWRSDQDFKTLELILTAPVVVASWISLQYYGATVAPQVFGCGDKTLHNVVGGLGVLEGTTGPLRAGLPWQSVHDGARFVHEPLRLSVCVEAPCAAIDAILQKHDGLRALFDNRWLHLFALNETGRMAWRYRKVSAWQAVGDGAENKSEAA